MTTDPYKQNWLDYCLWLATFDRDYAIQQAAHYEQLQPQRLENLQRKLKAELRKVTTDQAEKSAPT